MATIVLTETAEVIIKPVATRVAWIDGLRAICASIVVAQHFDIPALGLGHYAVIAFMVISGFCLMIPVAKSDNKIAGGYIGFMLRRSKRILPPYYAALLLAVGIDLWTRLLGGDMHKFIRDVEGHLLIVHDLNIPNWPMSITSICSPMWSIAIEWHAYFMFPGYVWLINKCGALKTTGFLLLAWYALDKWSSYLPFGLTCLPLYWFFALGMLAAFVAFSKSDEATRLRSFRWGIFAAVALPAAIYSVVVKGSSTDTDFVYDGTVALFVSLLLTWLTLNESKFRRALSVPLLAWYGSWSYSLYLTHYLTLAIHLRFLPHINQIWLLPLTLSFAYLFHVAVERPFMNTKRKPNIPIVATISPEAA